MKNYIIVELIDDQISNRVETTGESFEDVLSRYEMDYEEAIDNEELEFADGIANWQIEDMRIIVIQLL